MDNKIILITGGTGSFGKAVAAKLLKTNISELRIFSRDEKKQDDMRKHYNNSRLKFYLGDVRDYSSVKNALIDVNYVFHAAALKQVPSCEFHPIQATKTNVLGTENVIEASIESKVEKLICLSTDKAVYPINAMGISKALMEKVAIARSRSSKNTKICITRYGNVMGSRGSVIPLFISQIKNKKPLTVTDLKMTRFMMTLDQAVDLVMYAFKNGESGDIFVQKSPAASLKTLIDSFKILIENKNYPTDIIGTRHGEKLYEVLLSREEMVSAENLDSYFKVPPDMRNLNYKKYIDVGESKISEAEDYNSHNTKQLDVDKMLGLLDLINVNKKTFQI